MMRKSTQQRGKETTQLANIQEDDANKETPRRGNHKAWMTETKRILVRNIGNSAKRDIETLFARFGPLTEIKMPINRLTKRQVGFAFVTFKMAKHAATATFTLNGTGFQGRTLELTPNAREATRVGSQRDATTEGTLGRSDQSQGDTKGEISG